MELRPIGGCNTSIDREPSDGMSGFFCLSMSLLLLINGALLAFSGEADDNWRRTNHGWERKDTWSGQSSSQISTPPLGLATLPRRCWPASFALSEAMLAIWILSRRDFEVRSSVRAS